MAYRSSWPLRIAYIGSILGVVLPVGLSASGWVGLSLGRGGASGVVAALSSIVLVAVAIWRIWVVAADRSALNAPRATGALSAARILGMFLLYVGTVVFVLNLVGRPLMRALVTRPSENGIEYYVAGLYLAFFAGLGSLGLILFEYSRIRSFEKSEILGDS